jgi:demethylmenaquinone methyltransferase/2-methoxy-6-polyprenyl-1,4-benzoquinol methylase
VNKSKANFFDSQVDADWASGDYGPEEIEKIDRMMKLASVEEGMRILEPGCGTGRLTCMLAKSVGTDGHVLAVDISSKMIEACRQRVAAFRNAEVHCGAIENLSMKEGTFDLVVCHNVFPHFDHKPLAVRRLVSALRIGGKFIVFHFMNSTGINDMHRKADPSVLNDQIPPDSQMRAILEAEGLQVNLLTDDKAGYLLVATRAGT